MKIAVVYDRMPTAAKAIAQVVPMLTDATIVEDRDDADLVISDDPGVLLHALKDDRFAIQFLFSPQDKPAEGIRSNPEFHSRFSVVTMREGLPQLAARIAAFVQHQEA